MKFEEARNMIDSKYNIVSDLGDAWAFTWKEAENMDGGDQGFIVIKDSGKIMRPYQYYFKDAAMPVNEDYDEHDLQNDINKAIYDGKRGLTEVGRGIVYHHMTSNYILCSCYEDAIVYDKRTGEMNILDEWYYGDPEGGLIDVNEKFCIVVGHDQITIYNIDTKELKNIKYKPNYLYYMVQISDSLVKIRIEGLEEKIININNVVDGEDITEHKPFNDIYREVYCPECRRKFMTQVNYCDLRRNDKREYAFAICTTCKKHMYVAKGELIGVMADDCEPGEFKPLFFN